jgi:hypothetical protein
VLYFNKEARYLSRDFVLRNLKQHGLVLVDFFKSTGLSRTFNGLEIIPRLFLQNHQLFIPFTSKRQTKSVGFFNKAFAIPNAQNCMLTEQVYEITWATDVTSGLFNLYCMYTKMLNKNKK